RLGYFRPAPGIAEPHCISAPFEVTAGAGVFLNVGSMSDENRITVELLDRRFQPIPGYSGDDCVPVSKSGFRVPVTWRGRQAIEQIDGPVRVRINWIGEDNAAALFAAYIE